MIHPPPCYDVTSLQLLINIEIILCKNLKEQTAVHNPLSTDINNKKRLRSRMAMLKRLKTLKKRAVY